VSEDSSASLAPAAAKKPRKGPGRPEGESKLKEAILDAGEAVFADLGYAGTPLREVAEKAHVTQALISYYFGSKFGLFEAVFMRRGSAISEQRVRNLETLRAGGKAPGLRHIVQAFLTPTLELRASPKGRDFLRLQARLHTEPPEISYRLRNEAYDQSTRMYVEALRTALPALSQKDAYWRMTLLVGAYMYAFSDTHRLEELAPGVCDPEDPQEIIDQITSFVVAGFRAKP
jgi:AcrR family transcriptional regulator